jgi:predicted oxidoreductase
VRLSVLTRKTLGGLQTDLSGRVLRRGRHTPCPACMPPAKWPASAAVGMHGYRALEGTFLGGCLYSGRVAGRSAAAALG